MPQYDRSRHGFLLSRIMVRLNASTFQRASLIRHHGGVSGLKSSKSCRAIKRVARIIFAREARYIRSSNVALLPAIIAPCAPDLRISNAAAILDAMADVAFAAQEEWPSGAADRRTVFPSRTASVQIEDKSKVI